MPSASGIDVMCHSGYEQSQQRSPLFDHLVGKGQHSGWQGEAERLGSLEINNELEPGRLLHG
jgi:hypothetical protein